jgi:uncharacterized SAM-binding protein YcdF (DUF218 family)
MGTVRRTMLELAGERKRCCSRSADVSFGFDRRKRPGIELWSQPVELRSLVLLGCRLGRRGALSAAAERRALAAAEAFRAGLSPRILACGGKSWRGVREADALCAFLASVGVPESALERELSSRSTRQNAHFAAKVLLPRGVRRIGLVTCDWHMARALRCFVGAGFEPVPVPAAAPLLHGLPALIRVARERVSLAVDSAVTLGFSRV